MRPWWPGFAIGLLAGGAVSLGAEEILRITPGAGGELAERVRRLERAVAQLQEKEFGPVTGAAGAGKAPAPVLGGAGCEIRTPFDGVFAARAETEAAARAVVLAQCRAKAKGSIYCAEKEIRCARSGENK